MIHAEARDDCRRQSEVDGENTLTLCRRPGGLERPYVVVRQLELGAFEVGAHVRITSRAGQREDAGPEREAEHHQSQPAANTGHHALNAGCASSRALTVRSEKP